MECYYAVLHRCITETYSRDCQVYVNFSCIAPYNMIVSKSGLVTEESRNSSQCPVVFSQSYGMQQQLYIGVKRSVKRFRFFKMLEHMCRAFIATSLCKWQELHGVVDVLAKNICLLLVSAALSWFAVEVLNTTWPRPHSLKRRSWVSMQRWKQDQTFCD